MFKSILRASVATMIAFGSVAAVSAPAFASTVTVGGAPMFSTKNIIQNAVNSKDHTTLVAAVKAAGLVDTLLKPENKGTLTKVLTAHVVSGKLSGATLLKRIKANGGTYNFKAVSGDALSATVKNGAIYILDESGGASKVTIADVNQSNGVITGRTSHGQGA